MTRKLGKEVWRMNREDILRLSRAENKGRCDEREAIAIGNASRTGMRVGAFLCVALAFVGGLMHAPAVGNIGWALYFAMQGSGNMAMFRALGERRSLVWGAVELAFAVAFAALAIAGSAARP